MNGNIETSLKPVTEYKPWIVDNFMVEESKIVYNTDMRRYGQ